MESLKYLSGFGNHFATEAEAGALPEGQNSPQQGPLGLYAEQLTGSAFTRKPRENNLLSWLYRIQPSVGHGNFSPYKQNHASYTNFDPELATPTQLRWGPLPYPDTATNFVDSLTTWLGQGSAAGQRGNAVHLYACNTSMEQEFFYNADGELLIVPQEGGLLLHTEMGMLEVEPKEICVIPRGIKFQVTLLGKHARGYVLENFGHPLILPELGPIGANGLANPRDFLYPTASYEQQTGNFKLITKFMGKFYQADIKHNPLDVVAWHGNYAPYKYDLTLFNTINSVSFDHPDPSIFTVLTSPTDTPGVANADFVIFPERWMVAEHTFRPPYYHRNIMSEYMGLIYGSYDAKPDEFMPGGGSLHNTMSSHGPDKTAFVRATEQDLKPEKYQGTLAFMFETSLPWLPTKQALESEILDKNYLQTWEELPVLFGK